MLSDWVGAGDISTVETVLKSHGVQDVPQFEHDCEVQSMNDVFTAHAIKNVSSLMAQLPSYEVDDGEDSMPGAPGEGPMTDSMQGPPVEVPTSDSMPGAPGEVPTMDHPMGSMMDHLMTDHGVYDVPYQAVGSMMDHPMGSMMDHPMGSMMDHLMGPMMDHPMGSMTDSMPGAPGEGPPVMIHDPSEFNDDFKSFLKGKGVTDVDGLIKDCGIPEQVKAALAEGKSAEEVVTMAAEGGDIVDLLKSHCPQHHEDGEDHFSQCDGMDFGSSDLAVSSHMLDTHDNYPGTQGCEATCEGDQFKTEAACLAVPHHSCSWAAYGDNEPKCWSNVRAFPCPKSEIEATCMHHKINQWEQNHSRAGAPGEGPDDHDDDHDEGPEDMIHDPSEFNDEFKSFLQGKGVTNVDGFIKDCGIPEQVKAALAEGKSAEEVVTMAAEGGDIVDVLKSHCPQHHEDGEDDDHDDDDKDDHEVPTMDSMHGPPVEVPTMDSMQGAPGEGPMTDSMHGAPGEGPTMDSMNSGNPTKCVVPDWCSTYPPEMQKSKPECQCPDDSHP